LQNAILATAAMDDVENPIVSVTRFQQRFYEVTPHIETLGVDTLIQQGLQHRLAAFQRNLSFGRGTAHQYGDTPKFSRILYMYSH
jgi:hypothetical protein